MKRSHIRRGILPSVGLLGLLFAGTALRADTLDDGFLKGGTAFKIMKHLREQGYKNVGVLRFEVKKGKAAPSMNVGKLNGLMTLRLENALILQNEIEKPIGITRGASSVAAARDKRATYQTAQGRKDLFKNRYPLAWGSNQVQVDAFLTGLVDISPDFRKTKVTVRIFDTKNTDLRDLVSFEVKTDRNVLRDMGHTFVITKRAMNIKSRDGVITDDELDGEAIQDIIDDGGADVGKEDRPKEDLPKDDPGGMGMDPVNPPEGGKNVQAVKEYLDFEILVDGNPAVVKDGVIDTPLPDQKITVKLRAKTKLGLLLKVNGVNTLNMEKDLRDRMESSWWILEPDQEYTVSGFYKGNQRRPFTVVSDIDVDFSDLGDNQERHGTFSFEVFTGKGGGSGLEPSVVIRQRKTSNLTKATSRTTTLASLQNTIKYSMNKAAKRNFIVPGAGAEDVTLQTTEFTGNFVAGCEIRYRPR